MRISHSACAMAAALLAGAAGAAPSRAGDVEITLRGVEARGGELLVGLQTEDQFMQPAGAYGAVVADPAAGDHVIVIEDVAPGVYSMSAFHDEDGDGEMRRADSGWPLEGWAMSNAAGLMGPPEFSVVQFTVGPDGATLDEPMFYASEDDAAQ